jgi:putative flippase GtrA
MFTVSSLRYLWVGILGSLAYLLLLTLQVEIIGIETVVASVLSYLVVIFFSYLVNYSCVFNSKRKHQSSLVRYLSVIGVGFLINTIGIYLSVHVFEFWYLAAQIVIFIIVAANNYLLNKFWSFKESE